MEHAQPKHHKTSKKRIVLLIALSAILWLAIALAFNKNGFKQAKTVNSDTPQLAQVTITPAGFSPATVSVRRNTVVQWKSTDGKATHIIAANPYPSDNSLLTLKSPQIGMGATYRYKFDKSGTYAYHDDLHPTVNGKVVVE
jgi:plastocyanin